MNKQDISRVLLWIDRWRPCYVISRNRIFSKYLKETCRGGGDVLMTLLAQGLVTIGSDGRLRPTRRARVVIKATHDAKPEGDSRRKIRYLANLLD